MTGPLDPPRRAPTGRRWRVEDAVFHEYCDGLISCLRSGFDLAEASQQLGLAPARGSRAHASRRLERLDDPYALVT
jgi:hypothetical protein